MKPMHSEIRPVGARSRCRCCATKFGRAGSKRNKALNHKLAKAGKSAARHKSKHSIMCALRAM